MVMDVHKILCDAVESFRDKAIAVSRSIHSRPEPKFAERFAVEQLTQAATGLGLRTEVGVAGLETAFRAEFGRDAGPTVAIFAEYDALPNGHSCGHNLIAGAALGAIAGLFSVADQLPGRIVFLGTPAEEGGGGKILLLERGALQGVDAALMAHPMDMEWSTIPMLTTRHLRIAFTGRASHAALAQFVHRFFHTVYGKIQDGESRRLMVGLGVHQSLGAAGKGHDQGAFRTAGKFEPQCLAIKFPGLLNIVHRKTAECLAYVEHGIHFWSFSVLTSTRN